MQNFNFIVAFLDDISDQTGHLNQWKNMELQTSSPYFYLGGILLCERIELLKDAIKGMC